MSKLDKLIELNKLEKLNRRKRLDDKLGQQENYGDIEDLFDPLTKTLNSNGEAWQAHSETWQAHTETMHALQNKTLSALDSNTTALKNLLQQ